MQLTRLMEWRVYYGHLGGHSGVIIAAVCILRQCTFYDIPDSRRHILSYEENCEKNVTSAFQCT